MRPAPRIEILLPFYGELSLLQDAVRSVLDQDTGGWRLTVVDDSTDPAVADWFAGRADERVRYYRNEHNLGITANFQRCLDLAEHEHVVVLGADDLLAPDYVRTVRAALTEHPGVGMLQPGVEVIDEHGTHGGGLADTVKHGLYAPRVRGSRLLGGEPLATSLLRGNWLYFPAICWRTDAVRAAGFRPNLRTTQDLALELELVERGERLLVLEHRCFHYRRHRGSVSSTMAADGARFREERALFAEAAARLRGMGWTRAARAARTHSGSRLHALAQLPGAALAGERRVCTGLLRHATALS